MNGVLDNKTKDGIRFHLVENPKNLIPILEQRLPESCFIYNQVIFSSKFSNKELQFYSTSASEEINSNTWIVTIYTREDYGSSMCVSAPTDISQETVEIPPEVKECFSSSELFDWKTGFWFMALAKPVCTMLYDISVYVKDKLTEVHPNILYYMDRENALNLDIKPGAEAIVGRLDPDRDTDFIFQSWRYSIEGSEEVIRKSISANASGGVFVDGKCVSGVVIHGDGLIHSLYTDKGFRGKGYGKLTMWHCYKECAKDGGIPCSTVELENTRSMAFHVSLGAVTSSKCYYIQVKKLVVD